jgi:hypothetical protein
MAALTVLQTYGVKLEVTTDLNPIEQSDEAVAKLMSYIEARGCAR